MAIDKAREHLKKWKRDTDVLELKTSSATVELAAEALDVEPARIAKTISLAGKKSSILVVAAGDTKIDNAKFKKEFGIKPKMLNADEVLEVTGHPIGGVCPFGIPDESAVFLDRSLKRFSTVFPACGSSNSAIELTCLELEEYSGSRGWIDVCKGWEQETEINIKSHLDEICQP